jgi:hypothetical protein
LWKREYGRLTSVDSHGENSDVSVGGPVVEDELKSNQDLSLFVDLKVDYNQKKGLVGIILIGEELKHLLKGHTFFFRLKWNDHSVRKF